MKRIAIGLLIVLLFALLFVLAAQARVGGGHTYSGGSSSHSSGGGYSGSHSYGGSSGGSSSGGEIDGCGLLFILLILLIFIAISVLKQKSSTNVLTVAQATEMLAQADADMTPLRRFDPNFSEIVFTDFCYSLFARLYEALGRNEIDNYAPFVGKGLRDGLKRYAAGLTSVDEIVIGSFAVVAFRGIETTEVEADVEFEANYTETRADAVRRWYVKERWTLTRGRDVLSPAPERAKAEHCPKCGAPLQTRTDGACLHCGTIITDGRFQWFVRSIKGLTKDARPRDLGGSGPEVGTDRSTVFQPKIEEKKAAFAQSHPAFNWNDFDQRVQKVAVELQTAWSSREWKRAQGYETGALFQMHRYWIDEYIRQRLRNLVENHAIRAVEIVKVSSDAFYDAITVRLWAEGNDYTVDDNGTIVGGSPSMLRQWSEYWTFIRGRAGASADARVCPNCGAPRGEGQSVICDYCGGKIVTGEFPWILSRIEQDEAYRG